MIIFMRFFFKSITPPLIWDKLKYIREYKYFLRYKSLVSKNIELKVLYIRKWPFYKKRRSETVKK